MLSVTAAVAKSYSGDRLGNGGYPTVWGQAKWTCGQQEQWGQPHTRLMKMQSCGPVADTFVRVGPKGWAKGDEDLKSYIMAFVESECKSQSKDTSLRELIFLWQKRVDGSIVSNYHMEGEGKGLAIGIDLGTTYSCVAVWLSQHERLEIITNDQGNRTTPSYVSFTDKERLIGEAAKNQAAMNPSNTVFGGRIHLYI
ncbi:hypothetical protein MRB53_011107 [Persea americana]|uniref:Uncharacterized protein n=1 Tax=Persea americana TaxID=3435 RepID=A0ACC2LTU5_PERAE|nr:hypothetical protein MRB53_011107 [Persea americana]